MKHLEESLTRVGNLVLEEWAMMMVDAVPSGFSIFEADLPFYVATAKFTGVFEGEVTVVCQTPFLECLTRNLLAIPPDEGIDEGIKQDSIRELANIVSGNFLVETYGPETTFELPRFSTRVVRREELDGIATDATVCCAGDGFPVMLKCSING